jgi:hypothetical protein
MRTIALCVVINVVLASVGVHGLLADDQTDKVVNAANALLSTLDESGKAQVQFKFNDEQQRLRWSNLPTGIFERRGLRMGDLKPQQAEAVMNVLKATLSEKGFQQIVDNVAAEETLNRGGQRGRIVFGEDEFYFSILGTPSSTDAWMWQFGGHHLAINATIVGDRITLGPSLTGGQPMHFTRDGQQVTQMADEVAMAFELVSSLDAAQQKKAILGDRFTDMILGPGKDDIKPDLEGIAGKDLTEAQAAILKRLLAERVNLLNPDDATSRMKLFESQLPETYFSWRGPTTSGSPAYYRVQGPGVFLEFAPQQMGGAPTEHIHAMYREFGNDYGEAWFKGQ